MWELMKNGIMPLKMFTYLDEIRERHNVSDVDWAKAVDLLPPRISEIRRMAKASTRIHIGRAFSTGKFTLLLNGLRGILGVDIVKREMLQLVERVDGVEQKIMLLMAATGDLTDEQKNQLLLYLKALHGIK